MYSQTLSTPTGSAGPKETRGLGWNPCEKATCSPARRTARSSECMSSRCESATSRPCLA